MGTQMQRQQQRSRLRTVKDAAEELNLSLSTTYRLIATGVIRGRKIGNSVRVEDEEIARHRPGRGEEHDAL
jgi:excisionase family DNA binding protein